MIRNVLYLLAAVFLLGGCVTGKTDMETWGRGKDVEELIAVLKDSKSPHRISAAYALGMAGDSRAVKPLLAVQKKGDIKLRIASISALGKIGDRRAVDPLISILRAGYSGISSAPARRPGPPQGGRRRPISSQRGRRERSGESFDIYQKKVFARARLRLEVINALERIGDQRALGIISGAIWDGRSEEVAIAAVEALAKLGGENSPETFLDAFGTCNFRIRQTAAHALAARLKASSKEILYKSLKDENPCLREGAVQAIGLIGDSQSVGKLIGAIADENYGVRLQASVGLARIGGAAIPALKETLSSSHPLARKVAARTLGFIGDPSAIPSLVATLGDVSLPVRKAAASAIIELATKKKEKDTLFNLLSSLPFTGNEKKIAVLNKIARTKDPRAIPALKAETISTNSAVRQAAARTLEAFSSLQ